MNFDTDHQNISVTSSFWTREINDFKGGNFSETFFKINPFSKGDSITKKSLRNDEVRASNEKSSDHSPKKPNLGRNTGGSTLKPAPYFNYIDHSKDPDDDPFCPITLPGRIPTFPAKMVAILKLPELADTVTWCPHGRAWRILDPKKFENRVITKYFEHSKLASFQRQANGWGFRRLSHGMDKNSYYHEYFLRDLPHLVKQMHRLKIAEKKWANPDHEPDLYAISKNSPLPQKSCLEREIILLQETVQRGPRARMPVISKLNHSSPVRAQELLFETSTKIDHRNIDNDFHPSEVNTFKSDFEPKYYCENNDENVANFIHDSYFKADPKISNNFSILGSANSRFHEKGNFKTDEVDKEPAEIFGSPEIISRPPDNLHLHESNLVQNSYNMGQPMHISQMHPITESPKNHANELHPSSPQILQEIKMTHDNVFTSSNSDGRRVCPSNSTSCSPIQPNNHAFQISFPFTEPITQGECIKETANKVSTEFAAGFIAAASIDSRTRAMIRKILIDNGTLNPPIIKHTAKINDDTSSSIDQKRKQI